MKNAWCRIVLLVWAVPILAGCNPVRREVEALFLLQHITANSEPTLLERSSPAPRRTSIEWNDKGKLFRGDLYLPAEQPSGRLLLLPGAAEEGKDDIRLVAFASALARVRFVVLVPDMVGLKRLQVKSEDVQEMVAAVRKLTTVKTETKTEIGICAFSYAVGPAVLAAITPEIRRQVSYIVAVGGYHSLPNVLRFATTGYFTENGEWRYLPPNEYGKWLFILSNLDRVIARHDREILRQIAWRKIDDPDVDVSCLADSLGSEGAGILAFVTNSDPALTQELISCLPSLLRLEIDRLDLANKDLSSLEAKLLLVHGIDDDIIPHTESMALARSVPAGKAELYLPRGLFHVDVGRGILANWPLWRATVALLRARDGNG